MNRRAFVTGLGAVLAAPRGGEAQQTGKIPRIGYLVTASIDSAETRVLLKAFREGLYEHGYVEGQNIGVEYRSADNKIERFESLASELVHLNVDLIVAGNTAAARAARRVTATIPIVSYAMGDPIGDGLVVSLARPRGNITGLTFLGPGLIAKRLQLLKEMSRRISRVAALWHPAFFSDRTNHQMTTEIETAALTLGLKVEFVPVANPDELDRAFSTIATGRADAIFVFPGGMLYSQRGRIVALATKHRLPAIYGAREYVELGGLISYGASINELAHRSVAFVDKILKGAKPADLPVEQPTKFELVINLKTAKALGLTIPPSLLLRADQVLE